MSAIDLALGTAGALAVSLASVAGVPVTPAHIHPSHISVAGKYGAQGSVFPRPLRDVQPMNLNPLLAGHDRVEYDFPNFAVWKGANNRNGVASIGAWDNSKYLLGEYVLCDGGGTVEVVENSDQPAINHQEVKCTGSVTYLSPHIWDLVANKATNYHAWTELVHVSGVTINVRWTVQK